MNTQNQPLVCICVPTYNSSVTIQKTLGSILSQTYTNIVVHVVDNASSDNTIMLVQELDDPRIRLHTFDVNVGGEGNFNRCIELSEGLYTAIFHADDVYDPYMIEKQVLLLESNADLGAVFTEAILINDLGKEIGKIEIPKDIVRKDNKYTFKQIFKAVLKHSNFLVCPSFMVKTSIYKNQIKAWNAQEFASSSDLDVWLRILENNSLGHIREPLIHYRISDLQFTHQVKGSVERADFFKVMDNYLSKDRVKKIVNSEDLRNLILLENRDSIMRSVNLYINYRFGESLMLLNSMEFEKLLGSSLKSKRGFFVFTVFFVLRVLHLLRLRSTGVYFLKSIKNITKK